MGEYLDQIPENVQGHIKSITKSSGLPDTEESVETIAKGWLDKQKVFVEQIENMDMEEVDTLAKDDEQGGIALTYSGSLVNIGPMVDGKRKVVYSSIGLRKNAPDTADKDDSILAKDVAVDDTVEFEVGPVKSTSPIFKIAVCKEELTPEAQEENIARAITIIEDEFVEVNKTIML